ncbi:MAG: CCA tRNA nucleotidyltransferase [Caldimicrobium sp.]
MVGGCVRDLLLGLKPKDFDIVTDARPEELLKLFPKSRLIGRRFPIVHVYFTKKDYVEISTFRGPEENEDSLENFGTPEEDAQRRDLTINALFYDPFKDEILDYVGGLEDLRKGIVRVIGEPEERYTKDPVRMLRVIRHSARTGFEIEEKTWDHLLKNVALIKKVPKERLRDEILKDLSGFWLTKWFFLLKKSGLLYEIYPFYKNLIENSAFSEKFFIKILKLIEKSQFNLEQRIVLFSYAFLPLINRNYIPNLREEKPTFERKELVKLFWALFFTFRFQRKLFEISMDMLRDLYKLLYFKLKMREISKRFRKKPYFFALTPLLDSLLNVLKIKTLKSEGGVTDEP